MHEKNELNSQIDSLKKATSTSIDIGQNTNENIEILKTQNQDLALTNRILLTQLSILQNENIKLHSEINNTKEVVLKSVLGGDSTLIISFLLDPIKPAEIKLFVKNLGKFPAYDVSVSLTRYDNDNNVIEDDNFHVGNIAPYNIGRSSKTVVIPKNGILKYRFNIISRNNVFLHDLETRWSKKANGLLVSANRVQKYSYSKIRWVIEKEFSPNFPEEEKSKVFWVNENK